MHTIYSNILDANDVHGFLSCPNPAALLCQLTHGRTDWDVPQPEKEPTGSKRPGSLLPLSISLDRPPGSGDLLSCIHQGLFVSGDPVLY